MKTAAPVLVYQCGDDFQGSNRRSRERQPMSLRGADRRRGNLPEHRAAFNVVPGDCHGLRPRNDSNYSTDFSASAMLIFSSWKYMMKSTISAAAMVSTAESR